MKIGMRILFGILALYFLFILIQFILLKISYNDIQIINIILYLFLVMISFISFIVFHFNYATNQVLRIIGIALVFFNFYYYSQAFIFETFIVGIIPTIPPDFKLFTGFKTLNFYFYGRGILRDIDLFLRGPMLINVVALLILVGFITNRSWNKNDQTNNE